MLILLLFTFIVFTAAAVPYKCPTSQLVNSPSNLNQPYYWPNDWNESMEPATYAGSQTCNWKIIVPKGMYATVIFYKDNDSQPGITCQYPNGDTDYIEDSVDEDPSLFIFTSPQFQVNLQATDTQGMFSFKVVWSKFPGTCKMNINLDDKKAMGVAPSECVTTITAPNNVFFVGFTLMSGLYETLRQAIIFDGDSINSPYVGNLYTALSKNIISSGKSLTVFHLPAVYESFDYILYMGMDTNAVGDVKSFTGVNCYSHLKECSITVNASTEVAAVATITRQTDYIQPLTDFPTEGTLKVYEGQINKDHLLTSLNQSNYMNQLPLGVKDVLKIYHLDKGKLDFVITRSAAVANYGTVFDGRNVKIHSFDHGMTSYQQDVNEIYSTENNEKLFFNFVVKDCDFNSETTLTIQVMRDGRTVFSETYTATKPPPTSNQNIFGDKMSVSYQTYGNYTTGFQVDLTTAAAASTCKRGNVVNMPNSVPPQYYWPSSWRENSTAPRLAAGQDCSWTVTVPTGYYARLIIDGKVADNDSRFQIIDSVGNVVQSTHEKKEPHFFPAPKFTLIASNEAAATFAFKITWGKLPPGPTGWTGIGGIPLVTNATDILYNYGVGSTNQVSLLVFPQDINNAHSLRSVLVFSGQTMDGNFVDNLYSLFKTGKQYVGGSQGLILVNVEQSDSTDTMVVQQYDYLKNYSQYKALQCNQHTNCTAAIDGGKKSSALVTAPHGNQTLVDVQMDASANCSIYYGSPDPFGYYATYNGATIKKALPFEFYGVVQFVISSGKAVFKFTS